MPSSSSSVSFRSLSSRSHRHSHSHGSSSSSKHHRNNSYHGFRSPSAIESISKLSLIREQTTHFLLSDHIKGISGILYKWVNYGRGWRPRFFLLNDGVLSYYKVHGHFHHSRNNNKIASSSSSFVGNLGNPVGEIHLKVSSIRESKSDDKRFSIFTGTKMLHLRAESREERVAWMEALQAVKDMYPRMSNSELMENGMVVSTEKLKRRLMEEGVSEEAIKDSEQILRNEFSVIHNYLVVLQQKQVLLVDTLRQLETEKVDLENTLVDESQRQVEEHEDSHRIRQHKFAGTISQFHKNLFPDCLPVGLHCGPKQALHLRTFVSM